MSINILHCDQYQMRRNPRYGHLYKLDPSPEDLVRLLRMHRSGRYPKLPPGFHEANLRRSKLDDILMLQRADDGKLYIISPILDHKGKRQNCRTCDGVWNPKKYRKETNPLVILSNFKSQTDQGPKGWMHEYALTDLNYAICIIRETKSYKSPPEEASVHPTNTGSSVGDDKNSNENVHDGQRQQTSVVPHTNPIGSLFQNVARQTNDGIQDIPVPSPSYDLPDLEHMEGFIQDFGIQVNGSTQDPSASIFQNIEEFWNDPYCSLW